jgi:hypothetical protein
MRKNIDEAISIINDVMKSMPECTNKSFLKGAIRELNEAKLAEIPSLYWETDDYKYGIKVLLSEKPLEKRLCKAVEELSELSTKIMQYINKPESISPGDIEEEIADVDMHMQILKEHFPVPLTIRQQKIERFLNSKDFLKYNESYVQKNYDKFHIKTKEMEASNMAHYTNFLVGTINPGKDSLEMRIEEKRNAHQEDGPKND